MRRALVLAIVVAGSAVACGADGVLDLLPRPADGGAGDGGAPGDGGAASTSDGSVSDAAGEAAAPCDGGACPCGLTDCGGTCVDLKNDPTHCGSCTGTLLHYQYCHDGTPECLPGFAMCNGACHDFASDPDHCGACDNAACGAGDKCENGVCAAGTCTGGKTGCPATNARVSCVDLASGEPYCGACTTVCGPAEICVAGSCRPYGPATPCNTCPCATDCGRVAGSPAACCPGVAGTTQPICVHATACP
jgi:hypothetical protein